VPIAQAFVDAVKRLDLEAATDCLHEEVVCEYPMRAAGMPARIDGREAFVRNAERAWSVSERRVTGTRICRLGDSSWCLVEHTLETTFPWPGGEFSSAIVIMLGARQGKIVYTREFFDTAALQRAFENAPSGAGET
jgi:ketosteroid isomerase-like protein